MADPLSRRHGTAPADQDNPTASGCPATGPKAHRSTVVACSFPAVQLAGDPIGPRQVFTWLAFAENVNRLGLIGSMAVSTATTPHAAFVRRPVSYTHLTL